VGFGGSAADYKINVQTSGIAAHSDEYSCVGTQRKCRNGQPETTRKGSVRVKYHFDCMMEFHVVASPMKNTDFGRLNGSSKKNENRRTNAEQVRRYVFRRSDYEKMLSTWESFQP
jgi:hypothetical protein